MSWNEEIDGAAADVDQSSHNVLDVALARANYTKNRNRFAPRLVYSRHVTI